MKTNHFIWLVVGLSLLSVEVKSQTAADSKERYLNLLKDNAAWEAKVTAAVMRKKYKTDEATEETLSKMLYDQKVAIATTLVNFSTAIDLGERLSVIVAKNDSITDIYLRGLKTKSIFKNKVLRPDDNSRFAIAIRMKDQLKLDTQQVRKLFIEVNRAQLLSEKEAFSLRGFERQELPKILSEVQYTALLKSANHKQALGWAKGDWKEMEQRGLTEGLDSATVIKEIYKYDIATLVNQDKYGESIPSSASLSALAVPMPAALSKLKTARRYNNPTPDKSSNVNFAW